MAFSLARDFEIKTLRGEACARRLLTMRKEGFRPDLVIAHPGWGESLFVKDIWPDAVLVSYMEFFYHANGYEVGFDPEFPKRGIISDVRVHLKNAPFLLALDDSDCGISPTHWQHTSLPAAYRDKVSVLFDGVDTDRVQPDPDASVMLEQSPDAGDGSGAHSSVLPKVLGRNDEVVTFVNRCLEPYRGYHIFMRALPRILEQRPDAHVLIIGGDSNGYGAQPAAGTTWREVFLREVRDRIDESRIHFLGVVPYKTYLSVLQISSCHVYLTYPFVLSWSCIEAMSAGCLVVGSRTPPVEEVIVHNENGLLVEFFDIAGLADTVVNCLSDPDAWAHLRSAARRTVQERYDLKRICLPALFGFIESRLPQSATGATQSQRP